MDGNNYGGTSPRLTRHPLNRNSRRLLAWVAEIDPGRRTPKAPAEKNGTHPSTIGLHGRRLPPGLSTRCRFGRILSTRCNHSNSFTLGGPVDAHHNQARFQWRAGPADAPDQYAGFDVIVTEDGRIRSVYKFMDAAHALGRGYSATGLESEGARAAGRLVAKPT